jgi:Uncharacterized protein conserved in bacteria (DUF2252)
MKLRESMWLAAIAIAAGAACSSKPATSPADATAGPDAPAIPGIDAPVEFDAPVPTPDAGPAVLPPPIAPADFTHALDKAYIRALQTWLDDAAFDVKWASMIGDRVSLLGGASSAFHADLASRAAALPGGEVNCHGDPKLDNFGWTIADGHGVFSNNDFDESGLCPGAADILQFLVATDLQFADAALDQAALDAYVDTLISDGNATAIDPASEPVWADVRSKGLSKAVKNDAIVLGGEVQAATADEIAAVRALAAADPRFPATVVDVTRDVHTDGGSAGWRRFWLLTEDAAKVRTIIELKELGTPGTEFGPHSATEDGPDRFDLLKPYWWGTTGLADHFFVSLLGSRFVARDRFTRTNPKPSKMTAAEILGMTKAEASLLARKHRAAWAAFDPTAVRAWLAASAATLTTRWRDAYSAAGGAP